MNVKLSIYGYKQDVVKLDEDGKEIPPTKKLRVVMEGDNAMIMNIQSYLNQTFRVE